MAFIKRGVAASVRVIPSQNLGHATDARAPHPYLGEERAGLVWDGEHWVPKSEWEARDKGQGSQD